MSKAERHELTTLVKKRERVMKAAADDRAAQMLADFDAQSARRAVKDAQATILDRCKALGVPAEFAPWIEIGWRGRGENAVSERRAELRRAAKSRIEAMTLEAKTRIERLSLEAQTEIVRGGIESEAARAFIDAMPALDQLMPAVDAGEIKRLVDDRRRKGRSIWDDA